MNAEAKNSRTISKPIRDLPQLLDTVAGLERLFPGHLFLYRGQTELHERIRSSGSREKVSNPEVHAGWRALACGMLGLPYLEGSTRFAEAILQHYGAPTHYVDLTRDPHVAAWFALHHAKRDNQIFLGTCFRQIPYICYERIQAEYGYVLVLAIPHSEKLEKSNVLFSLEGLPANLVRPFRQKGWLLLDQPPILPDPNQFWVCSMPILNESFRTDLTSRYLFPGPGEDAAFKKLSTLPYVQVPFGYLGAASNQEASEDVSHDRWYFGRRALDLPEYLESARDESINHKWEDYIIFEPDPMRMWRNWRSALTERFPDHPADIGQTTKITVAPAAFELLNSEANSRCSWPLVGSNDILFTFAALDHDKVSEHGPKYLGAWLHREGDLILETPVDSDEQIMSPARGHGYLYREGQLSRVEITNCCECGSPESHDQRVFSVLQLSRLVKEGRLLLLPHPVLSELGWFVLLCPNESERLQPSVDKFHHVLNALLGPSSKKSSELSKQELSKIARIKEESQKAFEAAKTIPVEDPRWNLINQQIEKFISTEGLPDELTSLVVDGQLVVGVREAQLPTADLPDAAIFYLWSTRFGSIGTLSFIWTRQKTSLRVYLESDDPRIQHLKVLPILLAVIDVGIRSANKLFEIDLRSVATLCTIPEQLRCVRDFPAARLSVMDTLNEPSAQSPPEHWLRHGYINRLAEEIREAIDCIAENTLIDNIADEACRMREQGFENCYQTFPFQEDVCRFCKERLAGANDHFLRPFFDSHRLSKKAHAPCLGYQLQQLMTSALYSVELTRCGTCIPSYDSDGRLDVIQLDTGFLGSRARTFWQNLPWSVIHLYREAIGPRSFPADIETLYGSLQGWEGSAEEGYLAIKRLMADAFKRKSNRLIRTYVSIYEGGPLVGVRLTEIGDEVMATFFTSIGGFVQSSMSPKSGNWKLHTIPSLAAKQQFFERLQKTGDLDQLSNDEQIRTYREKFDVWMERIELAVGVSLATMIRRLWTTSPTDRAPIIDDLEALAPEVMDLPRARYITKICDLED